MPVAEADYNELTSSRTPNEPYRVELVDDSS
jgi:hypothetical protein